MESGGAVTPGRGPRRFVYVDDGVPAAGTRFLMASCAARDCEFVKINPATFDFSTADQLQVGDMLYRPAVSFVAQRVEQILYNQGAATFYATPEAVLFGCMNPTLVFQRAGLSVPRTIFCNTADKQVLTHYAKRLGGFPLVFKIPGFSTGIGVGRLDSAASLFSFVDLSLALGRYPLLMAYVPDALHWRLVVVGDRVVASYRNVVIEDDFRSTATRSPDDYSASPSSEIQALAVGAARALKVEFAGVDVLEHSSGRPYLLEANFPCYYAQAQDVAGIDISGAMIDHLLAKARRLEAETS